MTKHEREVILLIGYAPKKERKIASQKPDDHVVIAIIFANHINDMKCSFRSELDSVTSNPQDKKTKYSVY